MMEARKTKVLLIEDTAGGAFALKDVLKKVSGPDASMEISMEFTENIAKGLKRLGEGGVDVVLLDCSKDGAGNDGADKFRQLRAQDASVPVVVVGNSSKDDIATQSIGSGAREFLVKDEVVADKQFDQKKVESKIEAQKDLEELAESINQKLKQ